MVTVASISQQIWDMKYRLQGPAGEPVDRTIEDTWRRVARGRRRRPRRTRTRWAGRFYAAMERFPLSAGGTGRRRAPAPSGR